MKAAPCRHVAHRKWQVANDWPTNANTSSTSTCCQDLSFTPCYTTGDSFPRVHRTWDRTWILYRDWTWLETIRFKETSHIPLSLECKWNDMCLNSCISYLWPHICLHPKESAQIGEKYFFWTPFVDRSGLWMTKTRNTWLKVKTCP